MSIKKLTELYEIIYQKATSLSASDLRDKLRKDTNKQDTIWRKSKCTDYSIYSSENYLAELITGYEACSKQGMRVGIKWLKENYSAKKLNRMSFFDDYPGIGLSTLHLLEEGFETFIRHDVKEQLDIMKRVLKEHGYSMPVNDKKLAGRYDVVFSFEIIEHVIEPMPYVQKLDDLLKPGGILIETSGFGKPADGPLAGHFEEYTYNKGVVAARAMGRKVSAWRKANGYELVFRGFNNKPRIWVKHG